MNRVRYLLSAVVLLLFGLTLSGPGCNIFDEIGNAECAAAGYGGDDGEGGAGGDDGAGGAPDEGAGGAAVASAAASTGAGGAPGAGVGAGAGNDSDVGAGAGSGRAVPRAARAPRRIRRHHKGGIGTAVSVDCAEPATPVNVPPPAPQAPYLFGLTTTRLRWIATQKNIDNCASQTGVTQSRTIGLAFEKWVLTTMKQLPRNDALFMSQLRQQANINKSGLPASVIPEQVKDLGWWWVLVGRQDFVQSSFFEVKAVAGALTLGTSQYQILGLLDVASQSPAGVSTQKYPPPVVVFTTTSDTTISPSIGARATALGVGVWQQIVMYDANTDPTNPDLYINSPIVEVNPEVYLPYGVSPTPVGWPWPHSPLTSPTVSDQDVSAPGDPDPAEVD